MIDRQQAMQKYISGVLARKVDAEILGDTGKAERMQKILDAYAAAIRASEGEGEQ